MSKSIKPAAAFVRVVLFSAAVAGFAGAGVAQEGASEESLAEVTVTGSRIARTDASAVGPVMTLSLEDIEAAAPLSVGELLQELPGAGVSLNSNGTQEPRSVFLQSTCVISVAPRVRVIAFWFSSMAIDGSTRLVDEDFAISLTSTPFRSVWSRRSRF